MAFCTALSRLATVSRDSKSHFVVTKGQNDLIHQEVQSQNFATIVITVTDYDCHAQICGCCN